MRATKQQARREAKRLFRLCLVNGTLDERRVRQVVQYASQTTRRSRLPILSHFRRLVKLDFARHSATVESATSLPPDLRASVKTRLTQAYGPGLNTSFVQSPALIGGMRIKVASDVYDGTVLAGLNALQASF